MNVCLHCMKPTKNPSFCSRSCSVAYHNHLNPKRKRQPAFCKHCQAEIPNGRTVCDECNRSVVDWSQRTIGELRRATAYAYQVNAQIRYMARRVYGRSRSPTACCVCGYDKHTEVCHIRPIGEWPDDTPIATINGTDNLIALCPNCHWELDHGQLEIASPAGDDMGHPHNRRMKDQAAVFQVTTTALPVSTARRGQSSVYPARELNPVPTT